MNNRHPLRKRKIAGAFLLNSVVKRKGETTKRWDVQTNEIHLQVTDALIIDFTIPAGGQGRSNLEVVIKPADFHSVIKVMAATDRDAALKAMAEEMRDQLCGDSK
jgi:hypothetical protein